MRTRAGILAAALSLAVLSTAKANMLLNGDLESTVAPTMPDNLVYMNHSANSHALGPGWNITVGSVDVVPTSYFQSSHGSYAVDLVGSPGVGVLTQTVATAIGTHYRLTFDYSVNPENLTGEAGSTKQVAITAENVAGSLVSVVKQQAFSYAFNTPTKTSMNYVVGATFDFTATSTSTTLALTALLSNLPGAITQSTAYCGPVIDNLDLEVFGSSEPPSGGPIPEPASLATLGLGSALLLRRRSRPSA